MAETQILYEMRGGPQSEEGLHFSDESKSSIKQYIVMLLFLRLINPSLINPLQKYIIPGNDDNIKHINSTQKTIVQILQKIANGKTFEVGQSNEHLAFMNEYIEKNSNRLLDMYNIIENRSYIMNTKPAKPPLNDDSINKSYPSEIIFIAPSTLLFRVNRTP